MSPGYLDDDGGWQRHCRWAGVRSLHRAAVIDVYGLIAMPNPSCDPSG